MSVTTRFGIVFLLAPFVIAVSFFSAFYLLLYRLYGITPDLSPDLVPSLISMVLVWLLVWERLRGSLIKDLKWFHKYVLFKLYSKFQPRMDLYSIQPEDFKKLRADLEEYGRSILRLHLYPGKLPEMIGRFLELNEDFSQKRERVEEWGQKELKSHYSLIYLFYYLGIQTRISPSHSYNVQEGYRAVAQELQEKQPDLVPKIIDLLQKMGKIRGEIHELLDDFIKDNKLRLEKRRKGPPVMT